MGSLHYEYNQDLNKRGFSIRKLIINELQLQDDSAEESEDAKVEAELRKPVIS